MLLHSLGCKVFEKTKIKQSITSLYSSLHPRNLHGRFTLVFAIYCFHTLLPVIIHSPEKSNLLPFTRESITRHCLYLQPSLYIISIAHDLIYRFIIFNHYAHPYTSIYSTCKLGFLSPFLQNLQSQNSLRIFLKIEIPRQPE